MLNKIVLIFIFNFFVVKVSYGGCIDYTTMPLNELLLIVQESPKNCKLKSSLAGRYQAMYDFYNAKSTYIKIIESCPDELSNYFQLGVVYLFLKDKKMGEKYMNIAIDIASTEDRRILLLEKDSWLSRWDEINSLSFSIRKQKNNKIVSECDKINKNIQ